MFSKFNKKTIESVTLIADDGDSIQSTNGSFSTTIAGGTGIASTVSGGKIVFTPIASSDGAKGIVELATTAEADTGTDTARAVTSAGVKSHFESRKVHELTAPTAALAMNSQKITGLDTPTSSGDAATKAYVDAFVGQYAVLRSSAFYVNDNPLVQNSLYFGHSVGNQPWNWNDPAAVGGVIGDTSSFTIDSHDENWGILLPFNVSKVEVQCSMRPQLGTGDDFTIAIYTGTRSSDSSADLTLTKVADNSVALSSSANRYTQNDVAVTADYNAGTMIYVGVGTEDSSDMKNGRGYMNITVTRR